MTHLNIYIPKSSNDNLGEGVGNVQRLQGYAQRLPGICAKDAGDVCKGCRGNLQRLPGISEKDVGEM